MTSPAVPTHADPAPRSVVEADLLAASPARVVRVVLAVRDLDAVAAFYRQVVGLAALGRDGSDLHLGAGDRILLTLRREPGAREAEPGGAGLFHSAFLLPERADLGAWLAHAEENAIALDGAADHFVSEAAYLSDPEGNGVEITADRPSSAWFTPARPPMMGIAEIDAAALAGAAADRRWRGMPEAGRLGHVHLRVGDIAATDAFYAGLLGFDRNPFSAQAHFFGTGGYHHQIGANCWSSRGAPPRRQGTAGLVETRIAYRDAAMFEATSTRLAAAGALVRREGRDLVVADPDGIVLRLTPP